MKFEISIKMPDGNTLQANSEESRNPLEIVELVGKDAAKLEDIPGFPTEMTGDTIESAMNTWADKIGAKAIVKASGRLDVPII